jgi:4-aminobutyrate aminotransferase-like enzyme
MLPKIKTPIPGPNSRKIIAELAQYESPAITARHLARAEAGGIDCPIVWAKSSDIFVEDVDGNSFIDLTAGFGVANVGHANPTVIKAATEQMIEMPHAMGDAFPGNNKVALLKNLAQITPGNLKRTFLTSSGAESVEAALKTAMIKTGKPGIIAFEDAYHGLSYGALAVTSYRERFREPFLSQLNSHVYRLPYPTPEISLDNFKAQVENIIHHSDIGAVIIEPILGRGGIIEAPKEYVQALREITLQHNVVFIIDEIYTGFGRTGTMFAIEQIGIVPDLLCLGKGMNGGFPISAVVGTDDVMSGWGDSKGESLHTSTFLGNPVGCAMALACIDVLEDGLLVKAKAIGDYFKSKLLTLKSDVSLIKEIRGKGLMLGIAFDQKDHTNLVLVLCKALLQRGFIALPCGLEGNVLSLTPPLTIQKEHIDFLISELKILCQHYCL